MLRSLIGLLFTAALLASGVPAPEKTPPELPILMYHDVKTEGAGKDAVTPQELEEDLRWLRQEGYTAVTMAQVLDYVDEGQPLPEKPVMLSFDDGCQSAVTVVLPLLREYDVPIVLSVIGGSADEFSAMPGESPRRAHATWAQLRTLADSGLGELQNHSYGLHGFSAGAWGCDRRSGESREDYFQRLAGDVMLAQERIWTETGCLPSVFTYPYGRYSAQSEEVLEELGFRATLTCDFGTNVLTRDPACLFGLRRICRSHGADLRALLTQAGAVTHQKG